MNKKLVIVILFFISLSYGIELDFYSGNMETKNSNTNYTGLIFTNSSEDETLTYKIGLKKLSDYQTQTETFLSINQEIDLEKNLELVMLNIDDEIYGGNIYMGILHIHSYTDYKIGVEFSDFQKDKAYQTEFMINQFVGNSPFYLKPALFFIQTSNNYFYKTAEITIGYIYKTRNMELSSFIGKNQYLVDSNNYSICNFGFVHKNEIKFRYLEQWTKRVATIFNYKYYKLKNNDYLRMVDLSLQYKF